jgi:hypothetical protein
MPAAAIHHLSTYNENSYEWFREGYGRRAGKLMEIFLQSVYSTRTAERRPGPMAKHRPRGVKYSMLFYTLISLNVQMFKRSNIVTSTQYRPRPQRRLTGCHTSHVLSYQAIGHVLRVLTLRVWKTRSTRHWGVVDWYKRRDRKL